MAGVIRIGAIKTELSSAGDESISHITRPCSSGILPDPSGNQSWLPLSIWHSSYFPSTYAPIMCHLMKRYTPVTIIRLDTGASGMYQIPASGGRHLGNMVLPPPACLSHFSPLPLSFCLSLCLPSSSIFPFSKIPPEACLIYTASLPIWHVHTFLTSQ